MFLLQATGPEKGLYSLNHASFAAEETMLEILVVLVVCACTDAFANNMGTNAADPTAMTAECYYRAHFSRKVTVRAIDHEIYFS